MNTSRGIEFSEISYRISSMYHRSYGLVFVKNWNSGLPDPGVDLLLNSVLISKHTVYTLKSKYLFIFLVRGIEFATIFIFLVLSLLFFQDLVWWMDRMWYS